MGLSSLEDLSALAPVIQLLSALDWACLNQNEAITLRNGRKDQAVLTGILTPWLEANNCITIKGRSHRFTTANINEAVRRLTDIPPRGLIKTNEDVYHLLTLGVSLEQTVCGDRKGHTLKYIDWRHPERNEYHYAISFPLERIRSYDTCYPDVVLFVNGIPFVVIECQGSGGDHGGDNGGDDSNAVDHRQGAGAPDIEMPIGRLINYQQADQIPQLFHYVQLLFATTARQARYATVGTSPKFWSKWIEEGENGPAIKAAINNAANHPLSAGLQSRLLTASEQMAVAPDDAAQLIKGFFEMSSRVPTAQDITLWAMLRHERLLTYIYQFVVYDSGVRKVARYQQYFAVRAAVKKVAKVKHGRRSGGVVWHTTGSGKSLTMVMMAKALALCPDINNPQIVLVTDRVDLDDQLWRTFDACGKTAVRAKTGEHLMRLISEASVSLITTVIDKFCNVIAKHAVSDKNPNIFVLVDEGHRSNYGVLADRMRKVFPMACYLGFTGTPLQLKEKNTAHKFGGFIHCYTMRQAVADEAIVPLMYEGRMVLFVQNTDAMQAWFERVTNNLTDEQRHRLTRQLATKQVVNDAEQRIEQIALDISSHYAAHYKGTGLKAQLATNSRAEALQYQKYINEYGLINAEVIMSQPNVCEGQDDRGVEKPIKQFWRAMMAHYGSEEAYVRAIKASFARQHGCDLLIVVDKLLTGFDEPRNTVLYIDKPLKGHNILQAIARVNRLFSGKQYGLLVDYRGVLGHLNDAVARYDALTGFDHDDVDFRGAIIDTHEKIAGLTPSHAALWAVFDDIDHEQDLESMARYLRPRHKRLAFHQAFKQYQHILSVALATGHFYHEYSVDQIDAYKKDLTIFSKLRAAVRHRYSESMALAEDEPQLRKVMASHVHATAVIPVTNITSIFDLDSFDREVVTQSGNVAKADMIASRLKVAIADKMPENEVFYKKFACLVQQAIDAFYAGRINEAEYLNRQSAYLETIRRGHELDLPAELEGHREAQALFDLLSTLFSSRGTTCVAHKPAPEKQTSNNNGTTPVFTHQPGVDVNDDTGAYHIDNAALTRQQIAQIALDIEGIIDRKKIRDWPLMEDVVKDMQNAVDDYLFDTRDRCGIDLKTHDMDTILEHCITIARNRAQSNT